MRQREQSTDDGSFVAERVDLAHEALVDLQRVELVVGEPAQHGGAGAEVVDGEPHADGRAGA